MTQEGRNDIQIVKAEDSPRGQSVLVTVPSGACSLQLSKRLHALMLRTYVRLLRLQSRRRYAETDPKGLR